VPLGEGKVGTSKKGKTLGKKGGGPMAWFKFGERKQKALIVAGGIGSITGEEDWGVT